MLAHALTRADGRAAPDPAPDPTPNRGGLTDAEFFDIARLVRTLPGRWFVERREDGAGAVSALLVQDIRGGGGCTFALSRRGGDIRLDLRHGGRAERLGVFGTVEEAVETAAARVTPTPHDGAPDATAHPGQRCPAR